MIDAIVLGAVVGQTVQTTDPLQAALEYHSNLESVIDRLDTQESRSLAREWPSAESAETSGAVPSPTEWALLRDCEASGDYGANTGNGYYGAYQFDLGTWQSVGGSGLPSDASPAEQDARALALYQDRGAQPWPVCGALLHSGE